MPGTRRRARARLERAVEVLLGFIAAVTILAVAWSRYFRRGRLEYLLGKATRPARHIK